MIDIHCHILPGVDDGARTLDDSIEMARVAVEHGIHTIVATPHHRNNNFENYREDILTKVEELNRSLEELSIPLIILPGQEIRIYGDLVTGILNQEILPINADTPYLLIELPSSNVPNYTERLLYDLQLRGFIPIIAHPERNTEIISNPEKLYNLVNNGALSQITAASIMGKFGKKIEKFSKEILQANLTHFIASDAHNIKNRGFQMKHAYDYIDNRYGRHLIDMFEENAEKVIKGGSVFGDIPQKITRKKKFLGVF
jgi:protein-tyrosine phosphatase